MSSRTLPPIISAAILIVITLASTIPTTSSTAPINQYINETENLQIIDCIWAPDYSYANIAVSNLGTDTVSITEVQLSGVALSDYVFVSGDFMVAVDESVMIQVFGVFSVNVSYQFCVVTGNGAEFGLVATPPEPLLLSIVESEPIDDVTEGVVQVDLDEDVLVDSSSEGDVFVGDDAVDSVVLPENLVNPFWSGVDPSVVYALKMQAEQYLADVAARKALLLNYSSTQNLQENGETGQVWEPIDVQVSFHVRQVDGYWEAVQDESLDVVFGGYDCAGGVDGCDGGAVLNAAMDAASVASGGRVTVGCGVLLADCIVPKSGVELCGETEASVLRQNADANTIFIHSP